MNDEVDDVSTDEVAGKLEVRGRNENGASLVVSAKRELFLVDIFS